MKTIIKIISIVVLLYLTWIFFFKPADTTTAEKQAIQQNEFVISGIVQSNYSVLNYSIITVKTLSPVKTYHILLTREADVPKIGEPITIKIKKYNIIKINDKSLDLYKQADG